MKTQPVHKQRKLRRRQDGLVWPGQSEGFPEEVAFQLAGSGRKTGGQVPGEQVILTETRDITRQVSVVGMGVRNENAGDFRMVECEVGPRFGECVCTAEQFRIIL